MVGKLNSYGPWLKLLVTAILASLVATLVVVSAVFAVLSSDATLSGLSISSGTLTPAFASGTTGYTASVANSVTSITVTPTAHESHATITVNGHTVASGLPSGSIGLDEGDNEIDVEVTAQDGTLEDYTVTVTRDYPSSDATLSGLTISSGTLSPAFASGTTYYTASVVNSVTPTFNVEVQQLKQRLQSAF